jgi:antitoxin (DNA-binding transcriptional repressor) of toxin-antitoxin stability system
MKSVNIRRLKHETGKVLERIALGESVEIRRRNHPIAVLKPVESNESGDRRPDFRKRLQAIYGDQVLPQTATELLSEERGDR